MKIIRSNCTRRDVLILQAALEDRLLGANRDPEPSAEIGSPGKGSALIMVQFLNHGLPARFRKSTIEIVMDLARHARMSKRALLKAAHGAWASIGRPKPRGWTTPPGQITSRRVARLQDDCMDLLREIVAGRVAGETATAARVEEMMSENGAGLRSHG